MIIKLQIPQEVVDLDIKTYREVRNTYAGIRELFQQTIFELRSIHKIQHIEDQDTLINRLEMITNEFNSRVDKFRSTSLGCLFKRWLPLCVGGLLSVVGAAASKEVAVGCATAGVFIQGISEFTKKDDDNHDRVYRMMADMNKEILHSAKIKKLF